MEARLRGRNIKVQVIGKGNAQQREVEGKKGKVSLRSRRGADWRVVGDECEREAAGDGPESLGASVLWAGVLLCA